LNEFRYNLPYNQVVGGGLTISKSQFIQVNGFSNQFYGWGGEDDEFYQRLAYQHLHPLRLPANQARYVSLKHLKQSPSSNKAAHSASLSEDGLSTLHYQRKDIRAVPSSAQTEPAQLS
jgi:beta-1,4-galactosyltransferase 1